MKKTIVMGEESFKLRSEVERIRKSIEDVLKTIKKSGATENIKELFLKGDYDGYLLSEKERQFYSWIREEYNPQIIVFMEISKKEKKISTLFFINALNDFINQIKILG